MKIFFKSDLISFLFEEFFPESFLKGYFIHEINCFLFYFGAFRNFLSKIIANHLFLFYLFSLEVYLLLLRLGVDFLLLFGFNFKDTVERLLDLL